MRRFSLFGLLFIVSTLSAQTVTPTLYQDLHWRNIGPFRGGRTVAAVGVPGNPDVFYIGVNNGGVWRSNDYGRTWVPIFDDEPTGSIGAIAVAPSDPNVIYVGSGEGLQRPDLSTGDGIYRSSDAGQTWEHLGLRDGQQIPAIVVDPRDPNRLFVAVLGHPYGPNEQRGIFRSTDGGQTFQKVLYVDQNTGGMEVLLDPSNPDHVYAVLWAARQAPWEIGSSWTLSNQNGLYHSTDGGTTWHKIGDGFPTAGQGLGRIGPAIAPSDPNRMYAIVGADTLGGVYRSDDAGMHWRLMSTDYRLWGRDGDFNEVKVDPKNPDVLYIANVVTWKSADGGHTFTGWRGAPGGDDYHRLWIHPDHPNIILNAADQGAIITVNGGKTWSSWYNQSTAQFYHVNTDNAFPYRVCGGQQESGSACIDSRGNDGAITFREWHPVAVEEYGYVAPDPLNPDIVYGGKVSRYDRRTGQSQEVGPRVFRGDDYRVVRTQPVLFSPTNPHELYFASNRLWRTADGGQHWTALSPDLTREHPDVPAVLGAFTSLDPEHGNHRGVIYTIAPSPVDSNVIWVGTDDGLIHVTEDGGAHWRNVSPPGLVPWAKVSIMDASHTERGTAYAAINTFRLDDLRPHIWRTHDMGRTWTEITTGLPGGGIVNVVREDPVRPRLLFCGTEQAVYVSFDDGDHWQSLKLDMPATSIRDLVIKDADLVVGTHGRGFWILDDITPLRQIRPGMERTTVLFEPELATRIRRDLYTDTPLPPDEPMGENPPDGAIINYYLPPGAAGEVTLEILTGDGTVLRHYSSSDPVEPPLEGQQVPDYWPRPFRPLENTPGMHRFLWDLRHERPEGLRQGYPISAVPEDTPAEPLGAWVLPGTYTVRLTAGGHTYEQVLHVRMDPRVTTSPADLEQQHMLALRITDALNQIHDALDAHRGDAAALRRLSGQLGQLFNRVEEADMAPTPEVAQAASEALAAVQGAVR